MHDHPRNNVADSQALQNMNVMYHQLVASIQLYNYAHACMGI